MSLEDAFEEWCKEKGVVGAHTISVERREKCCGDPECGCRAIRIWLNDKDGEHFAIAQIDEAVALWLIDKLTAVLRKTPQQVN